VVKVFGKKMRAESDSRPDRNSRSAFQRKLIDGNNAAPHHGT